MNMSLKGLANVIYHGSSQIVDKPIIMKRGFYKDFGYGFYTTKIFIQAVRWAQRNTTSYVSSYHFNLNKIDELNIKIFDEMTDEWLDFIVDCRQGFTHDFDIVEGPMADDQIWNHINDYIDGILSKEQFWILAKFTHPTHQICFCTDKALECIQYLDAKEVSAHV